MWIGSSNLKQRDDNMAKPYCQCFVNSAPVSWNKLSGCGCGEETNVSEWGWEQPAELSNTSSVMVTEDRKQVTFHPFYSSGTAVVRGDTPLQRESIYYWEVKMLTETYGTDIMVGLGTNNVNTTNCEFKFTSFLGEDAESYGLSYRGLLKHDSQTLDGVLPGFCQGSIIGVKVDLWKGTLEFFLNRKPFGVFFYNLRRHISLFPMLSSTAAQSSMRLTYAASWRASLLVDAAKILASSVKNNSVSLPPGLWHRLRNQFWMTLPFQDFKSDDEETVKPEPVGVNLERFQELYQKEYMNGYYVDNVERDFRIVIWQ